MDEATPPTRAPSLLEAMLEGNIVSCAGAYRDLARKIGPKAASDELSQAALCSCLEAGKSTESSYEQVDRMAQTGWSKQANQFKFSLEMAEIVAGEGREGILAMPRMILENIQGLSQLGRRLGDDEKRDFANALICFGAACHGMRAKGLEVDFQGLAPLLHEWLRPQNSKLVMADWAGEQFRWDGADLHKFWNEPTVRGYRHGKSAPHPGPWDLAPMWIGALEAVELDLATKTGAARPKPLGL